MNATRIAAYPMAVLAAALLPVLPSACAWGPAASLWPFPERGVESVLHVEPRELRVAIELPRPLQPRPRATSLAFEFDSRAEAEPDDVLRLPLVLVNEGRTLRAGGLASARPGYLWYLFKLTSDGEARLAERQAAIRADREGFERRYRRVRLDVDTAVRDALPGQAFAYSVWLQRRLNEAFTPLFQNREARPAIIDGNGCARQGVVVVTGSSAGRCPAPSDWKIHGPSPTH